MCRSKTESTRKQALDGIIDLVLLDKHLLSFLRSLQAAKTLAKQEVYIWDFCDMSVQISSRLALVCLQEQKLFRIANECLNYTKADPLLDFIRYGQNLNQQDH